MGDKEMSDIMKAYLGDGVYASFNGSQIWLQTDNNKIALDSFVFQALLEYQQKIRDSYRE